MSAGQRGRFQSHGVRQTKAGRFEVKTCNLAKRENITLASDTHLPESLVRRLAASRMLLAVSCGRSKGGEGTGAAQVKGGLRGSKAGRGQGKHKAKGLIRHRARGTKGMGHCLGAGHGVHPQTRRGGEEEGA